MKNDSIAIKDVHDSLKPSMVKENVKHSIIVKNASYIDLPVTLDKNGTIIAAKEGTLRALV